MAVLLQRLAIPQSVLATMVGGQAYYVTPGPATSPGAGAQGPPAAITVAATVPPAILDLSMYQAVSIHMSLSAALVTATQVLVTLAPLPPETPWPPVVGMPVVTSGGTIVFNNQSTAAAVSTFATAALTYGPPASAGAIANCSRLVKAAVSLTFNAQPAGGGDLYLWVYGQGWRAPTD